MLVDLLVCFRCGHSAVLNSRTKKKYADKQGKCILNNSMVTNKKNEALDNHLEMMNIPEIKPVTIQDVGKAVASVKYVAIIQT